MPEQETAEEQRSDRGGAHLGRPCALGTGQLATDGYLVAMMPRSGRWDRLTVEEKRQWSRELARQQALAQNLPLVASAEQHQRISAIIATALSEDSAA